ncbi:MAG TPA: hypothetical protein VNK26_04800, partial [Pyrinomonadaceae bacterium]|nr:hypothetical protein [Pyrinomonadaceae bacterium]
KGYDRQFVYLNAEQRQQYLMRVGAGRIYNYLTNTPFAGETSLISPGSMYVMDTDERLYIFNGKATNYNHSSFLSGHPVICAGTIWVINGRIHRITNNSGHYKPSKKDLAACIRVILNSYIDQNFEVIVIPGEVTYPTAQDFLATIPIQ